ncbi:hypothetical protein NDU88_007116 [Pleurodeles waltl]|uniref:Uncharacterized protein n=1 Tax=Pleurodeles waltl TaxID=8319 RepID=A0AAV7RNH6_PLEWA|nr:hypothetical protein NDU88_007116 [Pleurodeles waltl]
MGLCSRLSSNAARESSKWRSSRAREDSVPRCQDDQEAGAYPMTPDFRGNQRRETPRTKTPRTKTPSTKTLRNRQRRRKANRRITREELGTPAFPEKQRTLQNKRGVRTRSEAATSQEGRG